MDGQSEVDLRARLEESERAIRRLRALVLGMLGVALVTVLTGLALPQEGNGDGESLRVRELVVVDAAGVPRARLGGDLPDAVIDGKTVPRGQDAAGLLLYDATGVERGGLPTVPRRGAVIP